MIYFNENFNKRKKMETKKIEEMTKSFQKIIDLIKSKKGEEKKQAVISLKDEWDKYFEVMITQVTPLVEKIKNGEETPKLSAMERLQIELDIEESEKVKEMTKEEEDSIILAFRYAKAADKDMEENLLFPFLKRMVSLSINLTADTEASKRNRKKILNIIEDIEKKD